ncbi:hypothetical protein GY428_004574, partial [Salmonella enterica subsp. enterica serovar Kentucky]|nr:hypothetical protein [Salmonella enterica subsp. enterica serovar Kentucky]EEG3594019.1 hypothetical protein [Salmonella enterica subsp. enterica serovar Kentucky]EEH3009897.1 hypothetical protein [Salmonella enterica subsp. enterica serovar Kentucky]
PSVVAGFMDASLYCWIFAAISALFLLSVIQTPKEFRQVTTSNAGL